MASINAGNIAKGIYIIFKGVPQMVTRADYMAPGKGSPVMRVKFKNVQTGSAGEFTFKTNESVEIADVDKKEMQFLYKDATEAYFMEPKNFEQATVPLTLLEDSAQWLMPDMKCWVIWYQEKAIGISLPPHVNMKVVDSPDAVAGNRVNAPKKTVKLENGTEVQVPLFIKEGEMVIIDTATGEYISRVTS